MIIIGNVFSQEWEVLEGYDEFYEYNYLKFRLLSVESHEISLLNSVTFSNEETNISPILEIIITEPLNNSRNADANGRPLVSASLKTFEIIGFDLQIKLKAKGISISDTSIDTGIIDLVDESERKNTTLYIDEDLIFFGEDGPAAFLMDLLMNIADGELMFEYLAMNERRVVKYKVDNFLELFRNHSSYINMNI